MASINIDKNRFVIPIWRNYDSTANSNELDIVTKSSQKEGNNIFAKYVSDWKNNHTIAFAGDLLSAALSFDIPSSEQEELKKASTFILDHREQASPLLLSVTGRFIGDQVEDKAVQPINKEDILLGLENKKNIYRQQIRHLKKRLEVLPYNPISYCELSRCYFCLGQIDKAVDAMNKALLLSTESRFIARSAARFFAEREDIERARYIIAHNPYIQHDPWMMATEIALNACMNRSSKYLKKGKEIISSNSFSNFSISELSSSIATVENHNGHHKESKRLLERSLLDPNDNSLAQALWMQETSKDLNLQFRDYDYLATKYEADFWRYYEAGNYEKALLSALLWCKDMPFSVEPIYKASNLAYTYLQDYDTAIRILKVGVSLQPHDLGMLNNLAYTYALNDQPLEAENVFNGIPVSNVNAPTINGVCLTATKGLIEYRKNNIEAGRNYYAKAMKDAETYGLSIDIRCKALLNFIREEAASNPNIEPELLAAADKLSTGNKRETELLRAEIKRSVEKGRKNGILTSSTDNDDVR